MTDGLAHLSSRALIQVEGPDWRAFLQGLITQDVETLANGDLAYGALLTPQGRLLNDLFVFGSDTGALLDVSAASRETLVSKLLMYRLRAKVQIRPFDGTVMAAWGDAPPIGGLLWRRDPRLADLGWRAIGDRETAGDPEVAYNRRRLALGVPDPAADAQDADYPLELNFDALNGIDFHKGCFIGQEITSRMHRRGTVKTRLAPLTFSGPAPPVGAVVLAGERRAGEIRGGDDGRALALLRIDRVRGGNLTIDGRPADLDVPAWLHPWFSAPAEDTPPIDATAQA